MFCYLEKIRITDLWDYMLAIDFPLDPGVAHSYRHADTSDSPDVFSLVININVYVIYSSTIACTSGLA